MATTATASAADLRSASSKHGLSEAKQGANKKARTGGVGKTVAAPSTSSTPAPSTAPNPCVASPMPWMAPGAAQPEPGTSGAMLPNNPGMVPPMGMPFFMPHAMGMGMMPPPMMAMQACMMMQMQMQAMQSMMQQQQQQQQGAADTQQQQQASGASSKPSAATAAAASLGYPGPLPCYPAFPFMPMGPPPMCFPHMPAPAAMQPQATPSTPMQQQQAAAPAPCTQQRPSACSVASAPAPAAPQPMQQHSQQLCAPVVPVDANATNLTDKDFAAFIDSFVSDGPADAQQQLPVSCLQPILSASESKQQQLIALGGGGSGRSSSGGSDSADDDFSFCLDDLLPLDAVTAQVESSLSSYSSMRPKAAASSRAPLLASGMDMLLHDDEEGGEESDLIFGLGCQVDDLLPTC